MNCPGCGADVPESMKYCFFCGRNLKLDMTIGYSDLPPGTVLVCPKCGTRNARTESRCTRCDFDLTEVKRALAKGIVAEPERRTSRCQNCGSENPAIAKFCGSCGWSIGPEPVPGPGTDAKAAPDFVAGWVAALCYIMSFFVPPVGAAIGAVFYTSAPHPWSEYRRVGEMCFVMAVVGIFLWVLIAVLWLVSVEA